MKIHLKTGGMLVEYLPRGTPGDEVELDVPEGSTPLSVMQRVGFPLDEQYLVALNGTIVTQSQRGETTLAENDELAVMPPLRGG